MSNDELRAYLSTPAGNSPGKGNLLTIGDKPAASEPHGVYDETTVVQDSPGARIDFGIVLASDGQLGMSADKGAFLETDENSVIVSDSSLTLHAASQLAMTTGSSIDIKTEPGSNVSLLAGTGSRDISIADRSAATFGGESWEFTGSNGTTVDNGNYISSFMGFTVRMRASASIEVQGTGANLYLNGIAFWLRPNRIGWSGALHVHEAMTIGASKAEVWSNAQKTASSLVVFDTFNQNELSEGVGLRDHRLSVEKYGQASLQATSVLETIKAASVNAGQNASVNSAMFMVQ